MKLNCSPKRLFFNRLQLPLHRTLRGQERKAITRRSKSMNTTKKSLSEQVNEVLKSRMSRPKKQEAIVKLGVTPFEAMCLVRSYMPAPRPLPFSYTFGVEIECVGCRYTEFFAAARRNGLEVMDQVYYNHRDIPQFKLTTDSSISGHNPAECVTPALNGNDQGFESLKACCKSLREIGATTNSSCGLHVHIGAASLTDLEYCNVFVNYMRMETAIESFLAPSRRGSYARWCNSLRNHEYGVLHATTKEQMRYALNSDRYHRVNPCAYAAHKTIEFRQHQGTANYTKISHWVKFLGKLVEFSKTTRLNADINRIEDIPFLSENDKAYFCSRRAEFEARAAR